MMMTTKVWLRTALLGTLLLSALTTNYVAANEIAHLTDENFEHDTQATTGSTTGRWLVFFHTTENYKDVRGLLTTPKTTVVKKPNEVEGEPDIEVEVEGTSMMEDLLEEGVVVGTMHISTNPKTVQRLKVPYVFSVVFFVVVCLQIKKRMTVC